ncbi:hypothetical protein XANCAGTX0491_004407 [Xanthoria calcicola]
MFLTHCFAFASSLFLFAVLSSCRFAQPRTTYPDYLELSALEARQVAGVVSTQDYLRRAYHTSAVAGRYVYIEGGELAFGNGVANTVYQYSSTTLAIDLSQDWVNATVLLQSTNKPSGFPQLSNPSLWWDEKDNVFYSGAIGRTSFFDAHKNPPLSLWSFKPDRTGSGAWTEVLPAGDDTWLNVIRTTYGYQASAGDTALVLGGAATSKTSPETKDLSRDILLPGLLEFNMRTRRFANSSTADFNVNGTGVEGRMHFVPSFGPNGLFMILGGHNGSHDQYPFNQITLYDSTSHRWYNQSATGNVPNGRQEFCVAGVNSTGGTYEIFLYGGHNVGLGREAVSYDEIYILTLPAFYWYKVQYPPWSPRGGHTCNAVGGSQIISIGGFDVNSTISLGSYDAIRESMFNSTDPFAQGLGIFNMTSLAWEDHYTANAPAYVQSEPIRSFYADNPQDGSQFSTPELRELFQTTHFNPVGTSGSNSSGASAPDAGSSSGPDHAGAIAGGVVGGVVGLAVVGAVVFYFYRRMKRRNSAGQHQDAINDLHQDASDDLRRLAQPQAPAELHVSRGALLDGQGIQEMQQQPSEMPAHGRLGEGNDREAQYELDAGQGR